MNEKYYVHWGEIEEWVGILYGKLPFKPSAIVAISRGGLIPGVMLSHFTSCRKLYTVICKQYDDTTNRAGDLDLDTDLQAHLALLRGDTVVIDDIVDTGKTFGMLQQGYPNPYYCALTTKERSVYVVPQIPRDIHIAQVLPDKWIVFPWEINNGE